MVANLLISAPVDGVIKEGFAELILDRERASIAVVTDIHRWC